MAEATTIEAEGDAVRVPMRDRPQRQAAGDDKNNEAPAVTITEADAPAAIDPEAHVAEITRSLQNANAQTEAERNRANIAEQGRQRAERVAAEAVGRVKSAEHIAAAAAVETATSNLARAKQALKVAREGGDTTAEADALAEIGAAGAMEANAKAELARFAAGDPQSEAGRMTDPAAQTRQAQPQQTGNGMNPRSQAWINAHPRFGTDPAYKEAVLRAHFNALNDLKIPEFSDAYFAHMDGAAAAIARGEDPINGGENMTQPNGRQPAPRQNGFQGARPDRNGGGAGNTRTVKTPISELTVTTRSDGTKTIKVPPASVADYKEFASINDMKYEEYIQSLVNIEEEKAEGRFPGTLTNEGGIYK